MTAKEKEQSRKCEWCQSSGAEPDTDLFCMHVEAAPRNKWPFGRTISGISDPRLQGEPCGPEGKFFKLHPGRKDW